MSYQPPITVHRQPFRLATRPLVALVGSYLLLAVCYSVGYGQAIALMATTSDDANRIMGQDDYSRISGMTGALAPLIQLGVADAVHFQPKSLLFGVFTGLWSNSDAILLARQNADIVHPGPPNTGWTIDTLRGLVTGGAVPAAEGGAVAHPGSLDIEKLRRLAGSGKGLSQQDIEKLRRLAGSGKVPSEQEIAKLRRLAQ